MSSLNAPRIAQGYKAGADLSAKTHYALAFSGGKLVVAGAGAGIGFCNNAPILNEIVELSQIGGGAKGRAAAAITQGAALKSTSTGTLTPVTADGDLVIAIAMEAAATTDVFEIMPVLYRHFVAA
jgi:hypothetical protein